MGRPFRVFRAVASPFLLLIAIITFIPLAMNIPHDILEEVMLGCLLLYSIFITNWILGDFIHQDLKDGTIEYYQSMGNSNVTFFMAKYMFAWFVTGLPIVAIAGVVGQRVDILMGFVLATMVSTMISLIVMLCTSAIKQSQMLVSFIALPFYLPLLIFTSAIICANEVQHNLLLMTAMLLFIAPVGILLGTYMLKIKN